MTPTVFNLIIRSGLLPQTRTFRNGVASAGGAITSEQARVVDRFLTRPLLSSGLWSSMAALYPFIGGSAAAHSVNLVAPGTYSITWSGTVTHDANGATSNGTTGFGSAHLWTVLARDNFHLMAYAGNSGSPTAGGEFDYWCNNGTPQCYLIHLGSSNRMIYRSNDNTTTTATSATVNGFMVNTRTSSGTKEITLRSTNESAAVASAVDPRAENMRLFATSVVGQACNIRTSSTGLGLTTAQRAAYQAIIENYNGALGRLVS